MRGRVFVPAAGLPSSGDYAEIGAVLAATSDRLDAIVAASPSPTLPVIRASAAALVPATTTRPLRPTASEATDAIGQAVAVIDEAQTVLLRSAQGPDARALASQAVTDSVETGTVLLRAA